MATDVTAGPDSAAPRRKDRTHYLYMAVIVAVALGIILGLVAPGFAKELKPLGTGFVALIRMMIVPVIFCTIVLGIGSLRSAAQVGRVGSLALVYFLVMSLFALALGLVVGNLLHPGSGLELTADLAAKGADQARGGGSSTSKFLIEIIPTTLVSSLTSGQV